MDPGFRPRRCSVCRTEVACCRLAPNRSDSCCTGSAADFVDAVDHVFGTTPDQIEEPKFVERAVFAAFLAGAIVGDEHDDGVIEHIDLFKEVDEPTDLVVGVIQESSEGFLHPGVEPTVGLR